MIIDEMLDQSYKDKSFSLEAVNEAILADQVGFKRTQKIVFVGVGGMKYIQSYRTNVDRTIEIFDETPVSMERRTPTPKITHVDRSVWRKEPNVKNYKQKSKNTRKRKRRK